VKALLAGAPIALVAGMLMGAAAKPDLGWENRPEGPQMMASVQTPRDAGPFADDGLAFAHYAGKIPDYVLGTDTTKATSIFPSAALPPPIREAKLDTPSDDDAATEAPVTQVADETPTPQPSYPSLDGGQLAGAALLPVAHPEAADGAAPAA
jgi:hypothetical protein